MMTKQLKQFTKRLKQLAVDDTGQDLIEYALVAALIGVAAVSAMRVLSNSIGKSFNGVGNSLTNAVA
jgi:pilus assembly protein Flp/PilA